MITRAQVKYCTYNKNLEYQKLYTPRTHQDIIPLPFPWRPCREYFFRHIIFILYFCRRFGRPCRVSKGKPVQVRRSPAAVSSRVEDQSVTSLCDAIAAWEDRGKTSKPEDLPNCIFIGNAFEERQSGHRTLHCLAVVCDICAFTGIPPLSVLPILEIDEPLLSTIKSIKLW